MNVALHPDPRPLDVISLCTGGYGLDFGLELAIEGARSVCLVEREAFAVAGLVSAMRQGFIPPAPVWSDARTFDGRAWRGCVDGVIGGIPCQPHSLAGKRLGEEDERDLWSTARRIIVQSGAWFVLIENVGGMLTSGGAERVWRDLRRLGFTVEAGLFTASEVGASHQRERLFILGVLDDATRRRERRVSGELSSTPHANGSVRSHGPERHPHAASQNLDHALGVGRAEGRCHHRRDERNEPRPAGEVDLANANVARSPLDLCRGEILGSECPATQRGGGAMVDSEGHRRREGRSEPSLHIGRHAVAGASSAVGDPARGGRQGAWQSQTYHLGTGEWESGGSGGRLFPPGPGDADAWRDILARAPQLEPAVRRMADGLASGLDDARIDRLRQLGNGVVPLEAGYAIRTLLPRLAARGSAAAAFLVRVMERQP